jgi:hypothetical protein
LQALLNSDASTLTVPNDSPWLVGDATNDYPPINIGDLVLFKNANGMAMLTVTSKDSTHINFASSNSNDWFRLNQRSTSLNGTIYCIKTSNACDTLPVASTVASAAWNPSGTPSVVPPVMFRVVMITYYVDATTSPSTPRLTRLVNYCPYSTTTACAATPFTPQPLAGVVEDLDLTYDLVDTTSDSVQAQPSLPYTVNGLTYTSNMIKKVNIHLGVRSEDKSQRTNDYIRSHISTSVGVRSLASVDRYDTNQ